MAENKKSFLLYCDYIGVFEQLSDREAGLLIKHILRYVNDKNPEADSRIITMAFEPIKLQLKRDLVRYRTTCQRRSEAGKLGGRPKKEKAKKAKGFSEKQMKAKKPDTVTETDTDTDKVIDINKNLLNEHEIGKTVEFCLITLQRNYTSARVAEMWQAFLINGQKKIYATPEERIKHFRNWLKTQPYDTHQQAASASGKRNGNRKDEGARQLLDDFKSELNTYAGSGNNKTEI